MKRILTLLLVILLVLSGISSASAATADPVQPRFVYINSTAVDLVINENTGIANCYARCTANTGMTVKIIGTLQQYKNGRWNDVKSWTLICTQVASMDKQWAVYSGYQYRFYVAFEIYNSLGTLLETHTSSKSYYYPGT